MEQPLRAYKGDETYIFVCYSHADEGIVYPEIRWLQDQGTHVWYDEGISGGQIWRAEIAEAIVGAAKFLYYISAQSLQSPHCNLEIEYAIDRELEIVPVYLSDTPLPPQLAFALARVHALHRVKDAAYQAHLLEALGHAPSAVRTTPKAKRRSRSAIGVVLLLAGVLLAGVGWWKTDFWRHLIGGSILPERSIVVLPFANVGNDPANDHLADGFSEELMTALAKIPGLRLAARTSSFYFKSHPADLATIGDALNVRYALEGSVRRNGDSLRITASLIDIEGGFELASLVLDRTMGDLLKLQGDIAVSVVDAFALELTATQLRSATDVGTTSAQAFELYLKAGDLYKNDNATDFFKAQELLAAAISLDPQFYGAYSFLTSAVYLGAVRSAEYQSAYERLQQLRQQVDALDPEGARPTIAFDRLFWSQLERDWPTAEAGTRAALATHPDDVGMLTSYARLLANAGLIAAAFDYHNRSLELDPFNPDTTENVGNMLLALGRNDEALAAYDRCLELAPARVGCLVQKFLTFRAMGRLDEARALFGNDPPRILACGLGDLAACKPYDLPDPWQNMWLANQARDFDAAFEWMNKAADLPLNVFVIQTWQHNLWGRRDLLVDPRYQKFLERIKLTERWRSELCQRARALTPTTGIAVTCV